MNPWLVRTAQNKIEGPYSKDEICKKILDGQLKPEDEICESGRYWIFLHEKEEVLNQLGIVIPKLSDRDEDATQPG